MWRTTNLSLAMLKSSHRRRQVTMELPLLNLETKQIPQELIDNQKWKIGDSSFLPKPPTKTITEKFFSSLTLYLPPIDIDSLPLFFWNVLQLLIIVYNFITIVIVLFIINYAYSDPYYAYSFLYADIGMVIILFLDITLIRWRVGFIESEKQNLNYQAIYLRYFKTFFLFDLIAFLGYLIFVLNHQLVYIKLLFFLKTAVFPEIDHQIQHKINMRHYIWGVYKFIRLIIFLYFMSNLGSCIYFCIDYYYYLEKGYYYQNGHLWLTASATTQDMNLITDFEWPIWYEYAVYILVQTETGVGYGNMTPLNPPEVFLINFVMVFNLWIYSYFANGIIIIVQDLNIRLQKMKEDISVFNQYATIHSILDSHKNKNKQYIESKYKSIIDYEEVFLLSQLPTKLGKQFKLNFLRELYDNLPILSMLFKKEEKWTSFAYDLIAKLKDRYLIGGEILTKIGQTHHFILALITRGRIMIHNSSTRYEKKYQDWQYVGQREFFFREKAINTATCRTFTKIYYLRQQDFFSILKNHPEQLEQFYYHHNEVKLQKKQGQKFTIKCSLCDQAHLEQFCSVNDRWRSKLQKKKQGKAQTENQIRQKYSRHQIKSNKKQALERLPLLIYDCFKIYKHYYPYSNLGSGKFFQ